MADEKDRKDSNTVDVKVTAGSLLHEGRLVHNGETITVTRQRAAELAANGHVDDGKRGVIDQKLSPLQQTGRPNAEPQPESDSPTPGTGVQAESGPQMVVENPDSLIPDSPGFVERRTQKRRS